MELIGTLDLCYIKVCVLIILYALLPFGAPVGATHLVAPAPIALSHQNRSPPPKLVPRTDFGKNVAKNGPLRTNFGCLSPPGPILQPKTVPFAKKANLANICLPKSVPQAKLRVYTQCM